MSASPNHRPRRRHLLGAIALAACLLPAAAATGQFGGLGGPAQKPAPAKSTAAPAEAPESAEVAAELLKSFADLQARYRALPRDTFDPAAVIEGVGRDPAALEQWVRDNTFWVPYQGALRGPAGVLNDRVGSSLDRALLLAELLRLAGHECRLARATLPPEVARKRLADAPPVPARVLEGEFEGSQLPETARVTAQVPKLRASLEQAGVKTLASPEKDQLAAARDHWWVQRMDGGQWIDMDVTRASAGGAGPAARETFPPPSPDGALRLPAQFVHEVDVNVVIEAWDGGKLHDRAVLGATLRPAEMLGRPVTLVHTPLPPPSPTADPGAGTDREIVKAAMAETQWLPALRIGDRYLAQNGFDDAGEVVENIRLNPAAELGQTTGGLFGGLGGGIGGGDATKPSEKKESVLTAQWLDFVVRSPGREPRTVRRTVFDLLGPHARAAGTAGRPKVDDAARLRRALVLGGEVQSLLAPASFSRTFHLSVLYADQLADQDLWSRLLQEPDVAKRRTMAGGLGRPSSLHWVAVARRAVSPVRGRTYIDSPNILNYHAHLTSAANGTLALREVIDLAANPVAALGTPAEAMEACVSQGVADTAAEEMVLENQPGEVQNTLDLLELPDAAGSNLVVIRDAAAGQLKGLALPDEARARVERDLADGYVVVAPGRTPVVGGAPLAGWWRVDPRTGETVGVMQSGYHSDITEEAYLQNDTVISRTVVNTKTPKGFWKRHPSKIAKDLGYDPESIDVLGHIIDLQRKLMAGGLW